MSTIWKYRLPDAPVIRTIEVPSGSRVLSCGLDQDDPCIWVFVPDPDATPVFRKVYVYGTGREVRGVEPNDFIGTVKSGPFVWHVFVRI